MGHVRYDELGDLEELLGELRRLPDVVEPRPGMFYLRRVSFLHFHTKDGRRWADAKAGATWGPEIDIPPGADRRALSAFRREVLNRYRETKAATGPGCVR